MFLVDGCSNKAAMLIGQPKSLVTENRIQMAADIASATTSYGYQEEWDEGTLYYRCNPGFLPDQGMT